ncbi:Glycine N-methyltransferase, partial [Lamellibrachia satsuma]
MADSVYQTRSLGVPADGLRDQNADGAVARVYDVYIGCTIVRTSMYSQWLTPILRERGCQNILDVACGTGHPLPVALLSPPPCVVVTSYCRVVTLFLRSCCHLL